MKNIRFFFILLAVTALTALSDTAATSVKRPRLAVLPESIHRIILNGKTLLLRPQKHPMTDKLIAELVNRDVYDVMERQELAAVFKELDLGIGDANEAIKNGTLREKLNADFLVIVSFPECIVTDTVKEIPYMNMKRHTVLITRKTETRVVNAHTSRIMATFTSFESETYKTKTEPTETDIEIWLQRISEKDVKTICNRLCEDEMISKLKKDAHE